MIVHTTCAKVGHRQAPHNHQPSPLYRGEGCVLCNEVCHPRSILASQQDGTVCGGCISETLIDQQQ